MLVPTSCIVTGTKSGNEMTAQLQVKGSLASR